MAGLHWSTDFPAGRIRQSRIRTVDRTGRDRSRINDRSLRTLAYCLSNTWTLSNFSPFAVVPLTFKVSVLPSLDIVRLTVYSALPAFFTVQLAALPLPTCLHERLSPSVSPVIG